MQKILDMGCIVNGCKVRYCNDITTLKWFVHEYKVCLVELRHTTTTEAP